MINEKTFEQEAIEYARILLEGEPDYSEDWEGWCKWSKACGFFSSLKMRKKEVINQAL